MEALTDFMSQLEREDDDGAAEGHGDLLDDFVSSALTPVSCCFGTQSHHAIVLRFCSYGIAEYVARSHILCRP